MTIQISVRNLVEFILRQGDIDNRSARGASDAMQEGSRIHRMIQKRMGIEYEAEVPLSFTVLCENYEICVDGRADGIIRKDNKVTIDEIKGTYRDLRFLHEPIAVHMAQAKCYAYFLACKEDIPEVDVQLTYCRIETEEIKYFKERYTKENLKEFFDHLMEQYKKWADFEFEWKKIRKESIHKLQFPFAYREGQKELAGHVYHTVCHKKKLFLMAPTGVGKTISTLFPTIKAVGEDKADKIFYLTAKTITRTVAEETFSLLSSEGLRYKVLTITAKEKICPLEETECNPEKCPYAAGHYGRVNDAIYDILTSQDFFDRQKVEEYAKKHMVCPFEMALDVSLFSDAVICDYNYLFDPYVRLKRFFAQNTKGPYLFLVDEAHNLIERGREMFSAQMVKEDFLELKKEIKPYGTKLEKYIDRCNRELLTLKKICDMDDMPEMTGGFALALTRLHGAINTYLEEHEDSPVREKLLEFYFMAGRYLDVNECLDEKYITYTGMLSDGRFFIKQLCVDPSNRLKECMDLGVATILFSATFLPIQYHKELLGGDKEDFEVYAKTAFSSEHLHLMIGEDVTTRYTRRNEREYDKFARYIHEIVSTKCGNYIVFCPSHSFLTEVYQAYMQNYYDEKEAECILQSEYMNEKEREAFLAHFNSLTVAKPQEGAICMEIEIENKSIIGFCVLGGIFSEGIDLKGEALIGALIMGTGLPQIGREREILAEYFKTHEMNGFDYAYRYPGMNKVLQAAGRVIRTVDDKGVVALLDERFAEPMYRKMFPREWEYFEKVNLQNVGESALKFWKKRDHLL